MEKIKFFYLSVYLDYLLINTNFLNSPEKIEFILKKYFLIFKHFFVPFTLSSSYIHLFNKKFFYESKYGLAGLQASFTRHYLELKSLRNKNINTVLDVGANVGTFTLLCNKLFKPKNIYSFEPIPLTYKCLMQNCHYLKNTKILNLALSNKKGSTKMSFKSDESFLSSLSEINEDSNSLVQIQTDTLNNFVKEYEINKIDLLKIDVESFENLVLLGASNVLKNVRYLLIEVTLNQNKNYTISSLFSLLNGHGYNFQLIHFRNSNDKSYGKIDWMDCLLINTEFNQE